MPNEGRERKKQWLPPLNPKDIVDAEYDPVTESYRPIETLAITDQRPPEKRGPIDPMARPIVSEEDLAEAGRLGGAKRDYLALVTLENVPMPEALAVVTQGWSEEDRALLEKELSDTRLYNRFQTEPLNMPTNVEVPNFRHAHVTPAEVSAPPEASVESEASAENQTEVESPEEEGDRLYADFLREVAAGADATEVYNRKVDETKSNEAFDRLNARMDEYNARAREANDHADQQEESHEDRFLRGIGEGKSAEDAFKQAAEGLNKAERKKLRRKLKHDKKWPDETALDPEVETNRMTEEELLRGLEGLQPPEPDQTAEAEEPPEHEVPPTSERTLDPQELIRSEPSGRVDGTPFWIGGDGSAYVSLDGQPIRVGDRGPWNFERREGGRVRVDKKYWDGVERRFVDVRPPERPQSPQPEPLQPEPVLAPASESVQPVQEEAARPERAERLQRPDREPDGEIDDLDYWVEPDGSAIIEDSRRRNKVYRVESGGLHWVPPRDLEVARENRRDVEGLKWDGNEWSKMKRSEWGSEGIKFPAAELVQANSSAESPTIVPATATTIEMPNEMYVRSEAAAKRVTLELAAALATPEIGMEASSYIIEVEKERVAAALRRVARENPASFDRASRALTEFSEYSKKEYRNAEGQVDEFARRQGIPHQDLARILHEPDEVKRIDATKEQVKRGMGFFGSVWNRMTFGGFASFRARRIERSSYPLRMRMRRAESELENRRTVLHRLLGIA